MKQMIKSEFKYDNFLHEKLKPPSPTTTPAKQPNSNILDSSNLQPSKVPKNMQLKCRKMNNITLDDLPVSD